MSRKVACASRKEPARLRPTPTKRRCSQKTDFLFAYPRPRAAVGLPGGFRFEASWIPPVRVNHVKSHLVGLSIEQSVPVGSWGTGVILRAHATFGLIRAPITCDDDALANPTSGCFQGTKSDDHYHPNILGVEAIYGWSLGDGRVRPFIGAGANVLHPRFQVNFTNSAGVLDDTKIEVDMTRGVLLAGAAGVELSPAIGLTLPARIPRLSQPVSPTRRRQRRDRIPRICPWSAAPRTTRRIPTR